MGRGGERCVAFLSPAVPFSFLDLSSFLRRLLHIVTLIRGSLRSAHLNIVLLSVVNSSFDSDRCDISPAEYVDWRTPCHVLVSAVIPRLALSRSIMIALVPAHMLLICAMLRVDKCRYLALGPSPMYGIDV
jgi:hypothetical protein